MKFNSIEEVEDRYSDASMQLKYKLNDEDMNNFVYINVDKARVYYSKSKTIMGQLKLDLQQILWEATGIYRNFNPSSPDDRKVALTEWLGMSERLFEYKGGLSFGKDALKKIRPESQNTFTRVLILYLEEETISKNILHYATRVPIINGLINNEGDRLGRIRTSYNMSVTRRFQTKNPNFQGIYKPYSDIITAPKGWYIVQVDSAQIEPRMYYSLIVKDPMLNWLINYYDDVYYAIADYCLRESVRYEESNLFALDIKDKRERNTLKTLVNAGTYGSSLSKLKEYSSSIYLSSFYETEEGQELRKEYSNLGKYEAFVRSPNVSEDAKLDATFRISKIKESVAKVQSEGNLLAERFFNRIVNHPQRKKYTDEVVSKISNGERVIYSPFGDDVTVGGPYEHVKFCFFNNPMQMAAARLSAISISEAFKFIRSNEENNENMRFAFNKHDEDVFYVKMEYIDKVKDYLKELRAYEISGWIPIKSDISIDIDYKK